MVSHGLPIEHAADAALVIFSPGEFMTAYSGNTGRKVMDGHDPMKQHETTQIFRQITHPEG